MTASVGTKIAIRPQTTVEFAATYHGIVESVNEEEKTCTVHVPEGMLIEFGGERFLIHTFTISMHDLLVLQ